MFRHLPPALRLLSPCERLFRPRQLLVLFVMLGLCTVGTTPTASAQSGSFLESLFRSIAEKQMQESQKHRNPTPSKSPTRPSEKTPDDSVRAPKPAGFPAGPLGPARPTATPRPTNPQHQHLPSKPSIRVETQRRDYETGRPTGGRPETRDHRDRGRQASSVRAFTSDARQFQNEIAQLLRYVQSRARASRDRQEINELRLLLPEVYGIHAETETLVARSQSIRSLDEIHDDYRQIDQHYHEVSFRIRSLPSRDSDLRSQVAKCDKLCRSLSKACSITPQFDRHGLHDQMVIAATYIQTLIDDLPTARMPIERSRELTHQARLLRQAILEKADAVETIQYEQIVSDYTQFVDRWQEFAEEVAEFRDPVLDRRLARVDQCGDETYALLWMPAPPHRHPGTVFVPGPIDDDSIQIGDPRSRYREQWMADAAALEGAAQYLHADLQRLGRYLQPASYSQSLLKSSNDVYRLARSIHSQLDAGESVSRVQRSVSELATAWESLSSELQHLDHHGLSGRRALAVTQQQQQMLPLVASLTASLLPVN